MAEKTEAQQRKEATAEHEKAQKQAEEEARKVAEERQQQATEEYEQSLEEAPVGEESEDDAPFQSAGHAGTLKQWEDSPEGQAFLAQKGAKRQTPKD